MKIFEITSIFLCMLFNEFHARSGRTEKQKKAKGINFN
jgi:hypothetical protein